MIMDNNLVFSDGQALTATAASTNIIDIGIAGTAYGHAAGVRRDIGIGNEIPINVAVVEGFNNLTSLAIAVQTDDDVAFGSPKTIATGAAIPLASLTAGYRFIFPAEILEGTDERYLRLYYTIVGTAPTLGKLSAAIVAARQTN